MGVNQDTIPINAQGTADFLVHKGKMPVLEPYRIARAVKI